MTYDPTRHHRRSIRLKGYDYSQPGAYFITIVTQDRACLFGEVVDGEMQLNLAGRMVQRVWEEMPVFYPGVETDAFVVMPNHIHGIVVLVEAGPCACPDRLARPAMGQPQGVVPTMTEPDSGQPQGVAPTPTNPDPTATPIADGPQGIAPTTGRSREDEPTLSLPDVVHRLKTMTTRLYADGVRQSGWLPFRGRLWQRNYYEHIIRDDDELNFVRQYILDNPARWDVDRENPAAVTLKPKDRREQ